MEFTMGTSEGVYSLHADQLDPSSALLREIRLTCRDWRHGTKKHSTASLGSKPAAVYVVLGHHLNPRCCCCAGWR